MAHLLSETLVRLAETVGSIRSLSDIYQAALTAVRDVSGVERASILLFDPDGVMRFKAWTGLSDAYRATVEGHTPWAPNTAPPEPLVVADVRSDSSLQQYGPVFAQERIRSLAFVPIVSRRRVIGKFMLYRSEPSDFAAGELSDALAIGYLIGLAVDRIRREDEARHVHERTLFALDAAQMGTWEWDIAGNTVRWSDNLERIHGLQPGTFTGEFASYEREIHPDDRERVLASLQRALADGTPHDVEYRILAPEGTIHWMHGKGRVEMDATGRPIRMRGVCMDIGARKEAEAEQQRLRRAAEDAEVRAAFLAEASALLSSLDYERNLQRLAELAVPRLSDWCAVDLLTERGDIERLAVTHKDASKVAWALELHRRYGPRRDDGSPGVAQVLRTGTPQLYTDISDEMLIARARDAEHLRIMRELQLQSAMIVPLNAGRRTFGTITFVTTTGGRRLSPADLEFAMELARRAALAIENARLFAEAREANRLKDEFLATLSHELRTPLNVVLGRARRLVDTTAPPDSIRQHAETIERNAQALNRLVEDLLDVSRFTVGQVTLNVKMLDLATIIQVVASGLEPGARAKGLTLSTECDPDVPPVTGDPTRLQQVVWNLVTNAIKFTNPGGRVRLAVRRTATGIALTVSDTGRGIAPEFLPHVFDMFRQAEPPNTREHGGIGLGLSIVRRLVELHGGTVIAQSAGVGLGSTFEVELPCTQDQLGTTAEAT